MKNHYSGMLLSGLSPLSRSLHKMQILHGCSTITLKTEAYIPMRDGVKLYTVIYTPKENTEPNILSLLVRTPYSCAPYGPGKFAAMWTSPEKIFSERRIISMYNRMFAAAG